MQGIDFLIKKTIDKRKATELEKQQIADERGELVKTKTKFELAVRDLEEGVTDDAQTKVKYILSRIRAVLWRCSVLSRMFSTVGDIQYMGGCSIP